MDRLNRALALLGYDQELPAYVRSNLLRAISLFAASGKDEDLEMACEAMLGQVVPLREPRRNLNQDEAARTQWWDGLSVSERCTWDAKARVAGVSAWDLKKASFFDRGVTFAGLRGQLDQDAGAPAGPAN